MAGRNFGTKHPLARIGHERWWQSAAALLILTWVGLGRAGEPLTFGGPAQGTTYRVRIGQRLTEAALVELHSKTEKILAEVDRQMSTYRDDSELTRFNVQTSRAWIPVSADVVIVIEASLDVNRRSLGAFDITVAPLVDLWGFGRKRQPLRLPAAPEIERARASVGPTFLEVKRDLPSIRKTHPNLRLDVNGIAPGFAVDRIALMLERHGIVNYLIELGGEIRVRGRSEAGQLWRVGIDRPSATPAGIMCTIEPGTGAVSTSGDYRRFLDVGGKRYSHIIDPRTGWPVDNPATAATVVADTCMYADAWATAMMVLGPDEGLRVAEQEGLAVFFVLRDPGGSAAALRSLASSEFVRRFPDLIPQSDKPSLKAPERPAPWASSAITLFVIIGAVWFFARRKSGRQRLRSQGCKHVGKIGDNGN